MDPFADIYDLKARWAGFPDDRSDEAATKLDDASMEIRSKKRGIDALAASDPVLAHVLKKTVCAMVKRAMQGPVDLDGVRQMQDTTGPFSQGFTFDNPSGDLYLTKAEKKALGIGGQRAFSVDLLAEAESSSSESSSS